MTLARCPSCKRGFGKMEDFPIIFISRFLRFEIPEIIEGSPHHPILEKVERRSLFRKRLIDNPALPQEVLRLTRAGESLVSYGGFAYRRLVPDASGEIPFYDRTEDITEIVREALATPEIRDSLSALESYVGKEVATKDLLLLPGFKGIIGARWNGGFHLSFDNSLHVKEDRTGTCEVGLTGVWAYDVHPEIYHTLVRIYYEGRLSEARVEV